MSYDYGWCGHIADEPGAKPCGAPIERWSREWKHRRHELDADHKANPEAPVGPLEEALFLRADRYAVTLAASVAADERIAALTDLVRQHEYYRTQAESELAKVQEAPEYGTVWQQTGPEPDEAVNAVLCLTSGQVFRRNKWSHDWQLAHQDIHRATHYEWPIKDAGPFIVWSDDYGFDRVLREAQAQATEFEELHRAMYSQPGYRADDAGYGRPRLAEAFGRIRLEQMGRTHEANRKAQAVGQELARLRRLIEQLVAEPYDQLEVEEPVDGTVERVEVVRVDAVWDILDRTQVPA